MGFLGFSSTPMQEVEETRRENGLFLGKLGAYFDKFNFIAINIT